MKVFGAYTVKLQNETYLWEPDDWNLSVWLQIETDLKVDAGQFVVGVLRKNNVRACQWLIWYLRGRDMDLLSTDFPLLQLEIDEAPDPEAPAADTPPSDANGSSLSSSDLASTPATGLT